MPTLLTILRLRRERARRPRGGAGVARLGRLVAGAAAFLIGLGGLAGALVFAQLLRDLPSVAEIESQFDDSGLLRTTRYTDRTGQTVLMENLNPAAAGRRALTLAPGVQGSVPPRVAQAFVAALDPTFWDNPGYEPQAVWRGLSGGVAGVSGDSITRRLVRSTLLPPGEHLRPAWLRLLREAALAAELTRTYGKERVLTWFLNSADFGQRASGADAAALTYFGRHLDELTLAEAAVLAGLAADPARDPRASATEARALQAPVLEALRAQGALSAHEAGAAGEQPLRLQPPAGETPSAMRAFALYAERRLAEIWGTHVLARGGLRVVTTLDLDLQWQADCLLRTYLERMGGADPGALAPAEDGSACLAAGLLPPMRPGDVGVDHGIDAAAIVVLSPARGEVLALVGEGGPLEAAPAEQTRPAGSALYPFIYLTAFATGQAPASMVLDVPSTYSEAGQSVAYTARNEDGLYRGPLRMRSALANAYRVPAVRTLHLLGVESVMRTMRTMGLHSLGEDAPAGLAWMIEQAPVSPVELTQAYGVIAHAGEMVGVPAGEGPEPDRLSPAAVLRVEDAQGRSLLAYEPQRRAVLSPQLAYLMTSVLGDEAARWPAFGSANPFEIGRPAGVMVGQTSAQADSWTVGFTPGVVVGVWLGAPQAEALQGIGALNGAAAVWHALIRYAARDEAAEGWPAPPGVSTVEVCDPSGLLPTRDCPTIVREVFLPGTEPTQYDALYRPVRVNRETGRLATLFTPPELVEERVYLALPPEAAAWAEQAGLERPPQEYDTLYVQAVDPEVRVTAPEPFATLRATVSVRGDAHPPGLDFFRLQFGEGLNPTRWVQIGADARLAVIEGVLGRWDTRGLAGLYTLQLVAVLDDGVVRSAAVPVRIDNQPPTLRLVAPLPGEHFTWPEEAEVVIQVEVEDDLGVERVEFFVGTQRVAVVTAAPYSTRWTLGPDGLHSVWARAYDTGGNRAESERVTIRVVR